MALEKVAAETRSTPEPEWNEAKILSSLAHLQEIHARLRHLRETVPRVLDPLLVYQSSPEALYGNFSRVATGAFKDVKDFSSLIEDSRNRCILDRAKSSRAESSEGITGWKVTEHKDWLDTPKGSSPKDSADGLEEGNSHVNASNDLDLRAAMKKLEGRYAGLEISFLTDDSNTMEICLPSVARMRVKVEAKYATQNQPSYVMTLVERPNAIFTPIVEQLNNRPNPCELESLLTMFASYVEVLSSPCIKCSRILDRDGKLPLVRKPIGTKAANNHQTAQWQAFHIKCS